ncbi:MAG TPA: hypothetical protein DCZ91_13310 [Lachnospiraceae bacterium]|nr:hypothetical protein [Lachnospiraceae bacterium]
MEIRNDITIFAGDTRNSMQASDKARGSQPAEEKNQTIYAGNLLAEFPLKDRIQERRAQAQERAMKIVSDTWNGDRQVEGLIEESRERRRNLQAAYKEAQDRISEIREEGNALRDVYGVDADSEEQQYLDLLLKEQAANRPFPEAELTEEESERLYEYRLQGKELTEYQQRQLELNGQIGGYQLAAHKAAAKIEKENAVIRGIREEQRKVHPMADARKQAEEVMEAARDEIIGMVTEEAKDHIDDEQEERKEESEAIKEKKEEQEVVLEKREEREKELEKLMEDMPVEEMADLKNVQAQVQQKVQDIVSKMNLVAEDIKGAQVDASL